MSTPIQQLRGTAKVFNGFKDFIARGNAIELAVGVVIGAAFTTVVGALQEGFLNPIIGWLFGSPNLNDVATFDIPSWRGDEPSTISLGLVLTALINFLIVAAALYFFVVLPLNALATRRKKGQEEEPAAPAEDILLLQEIRDLLAARPTPAVVNDLSGPAGSASTTPPTGPAPGTAPPPSIPPGS